MAMKDSTYMVNVNGLDEKAIGHVRKIMESLANGKVQKTYDGCLIVTHTSYVDGHRELAARISSLKAGIDIALGRYDKPIEM